MSTSTATPPTQERPASPVPLPTIELLRGIHLHACTEPQCVRFILDCLHAGQGGWVVTPNLDHLRRLAHEREFRELCSKASLRVADGKPLVWASRIQGRSLPGRVAGSDLISSLSAAAAEEERSIYLLGGNEGSAQLAAEKLLVRHPDLRIAGLRCPPFGFENDAAYMAEMRADLLAKRPDIVFVGLGSPKQERLIDAFRSELPETWWLGVGVSFSFLAGEIARAPRWLQAIGLEWVHRLAQEPRRLFKRYVVQGIPFAGRLLFTSFWRRLRHGTRSQSSSASAVSSGQE